VALIRLVRHAEPAALWGAHPDPGLSELGRAQARVTAERLLADMDPGKNPGARLFTSPLARCRETAAPLEEALSARATLTPAVAEIPTPEGLPDTRAWLTEVLGGDWQGAGATLRAWRDDLVATLVGLPDGAVVFTHFVAINVAVGAARGAEAVTSFRPGHASVTRLRVAEGRLSLVALGDEAAAVALA
jgi:broad specificity phosphatase PhoE